MFGLAAQNDGYKVSYDLTSITKDRLKIVIKTPHVSEKTAEYVMPAVIPGSYSKKDFGRFVERFRAYAKNGKKLKVTRLNNNVFKIANATKLDRIEYEVNDTWDSSLDNYVFQPGGTNIEARKSVIINHHGFYGYLEGYKMRPYELEIRKPGYFYGATPLERKDCKLLIDKFYAPDYVRLVDNPILYTRPDTISFMAGRTRVHIAVASESGKVKAEAVRTYIEPIAQSLSEFFEVMPVEEYHFLMYFPELRFGNNILKEMTFGALEHSYCSFYFLPEYDDDARLREMVESVAAHEFLHILTPLNIHSKEIESFDFRNPKMSKHLWLYEGVTEYFSYLVQLQGDLMEYRDFMEEMKSKVQTDFEYPLVSFTEMSQRIVEPEFQKMYLNVYAKGALIGLLLDIRLNELSEGKMNLKSLMVKLSEKYGPNKPFDDDELFQEIIRMSYPEIGLFLKMYVSSANKMPYERYFAKIGWEYLPEANVKSYSFGDIHLAYDPDLKLIFIRQTTENRFGLRDDDVIKAVDGVTLTEENAEELLGSLIEPSSDKEMKLSIERNTKAMVKVATPKVSLEKQKHVLREMEKLTEEQVRLRAWVLGLKVVED